MSWTDDRVETLTKLWSQGKSASEIAEVLGGVTRNAVIGKAHRLGLSGRPSPIKKKSVVKKTVTKKKTVADPVKEKPKKKTETAAPTKAAAPKRREIKLPIAPPTFIEERPVHDGPLIGILDLTERVCRWPIGDPKEGEFGFCGADCDPAHPYCLPHMGMAFQASAKKQAKKILKKSTTPNKDAAEAEEDDEEEIEDIDLENFDPDDIENDDDDELDDLDENNEELTVATVAPPKK